jgi:hypothetical protein
LYNTLIDRVEYYLVINNDEARKNMRRFIASLIATCLIAILSLTSFSSNAWAYNQTQLDLLKSGVEQWNNWNLHGGRGSQDIDLTGADLSGLNLTDAFLRFSDLSGANLAGTNLHDADLISVKLNNANLTGADLTKASFSDTDFGGANLTGANLSGYHYVGDFINFQGANLTDANLDSEDLKGCDSSIYTSDRYDRYHRYDKYDRFDNYRCETRYPGEKKGVSFYQAIYNENTQFPSSVNPELAVAKEPKNPKCDSRYNRYDPECYAN